MFAAEGRLACPPKLTQRFRERRWGTGEIVLASESLSWPESVNVTRCVDPPTNQIASRRNIARIQPWHAA
jgi:hypothetical protein